MNTFIKAVSCAVLTLAAAGAMAATEPVSDTTRDQRMDEALQRYREAHPDTQAGPAARAEASMKRGLHRTGEAIKHGAHKTADAVRHVGHKISGKSDAEEAPK
jgi:hypothetical protein